MLVAAESKKILDSDVHEDKSMAKSRDFHVDKSDSLNVADSAVNHQILTILKNQLLPLFLDGNSHDLVGFDAARKKFTELELTLLNLTQSQSIPVVRLEVDERIVNLVAQKGPNPGLADIEPLLADSAFLNKLQQDVNTWIRDIQKVTILTKDPPLRSTRGELDFWLDMEKGLLKLEAALRADTVSLTLSILKRAKRFHATVSFLSDTGLKDALDTVVKYNVLMKDFPITQLLTASSIPALREALDAIFTHINKKLRISPYPIPRALLLAQALSRDLRDRLVSLLQPLQILTMKPYEKFKSGVVDEAQALFDLGWGENIREFVSVCREMSRKRSERFIPVKVQSVHTQLQDRLVYLANFRAQHEQLYSTIRKVVGNSDSGDAASLELGLSKDALEKIDLAILELKNVDCLDLSSEGVESWMLAEQAYNEMIASTENQIISRLTAFLSQCQNANEMFRVFSRFNSLFIRPKIRGAVHEYQALLIDRVREELKKLHEKFMAKYEGGTVSLSRNSQQKQQDGVLFAGARDMPLLTACLHWTRGMASNLDQLVQKVEQVLGAGWENYAEGQSLLKHSQAIHRLLDTTPLVQTWIKEQMARPVISGPIFKVTTTKRSLKGSSSTSVVGPSARLELNVNFHVDSIMVFKDVRNLLWMGIPVPATLQNIAKDAKRVYPFAVSIDETLRIYKKTLGRLEDAEEKSVSPDDALSPRLLVDEFHVAVQDLLSKGVHMTWDFFINTYETSKSLAMSENRHIVFVRELSRLVLMFEEKTCLALKHAEEVDAVIEKLRVIPYEEHLFIESIESIQRIVDQLDFEGVSNLKQWTQGVSKRVEKILVTRLSEAIIEFNKGGWFLRKPDRLICRLKIRNQQLVLDPSLECVKSNWISQFHRWIATVTNLKRLNVVGAHVQIFAASRSSLQKHLTYADLLVQVDAQEIQKAYSLIHDMYVDASSYVMKWLKYQSLWDMQPENVFQNLGECLDTWICALQNLQKERSIFDNTKTESSFDGVIIQYGSVQTKVGGMYDQWQRDILAEFASRVSNEMTSLFETLKDGRGSMEGLFIRSSEELVGFISLVQRMESSLPLFKERILILQKSQQLLEKRRFVFPSAWLHLDQVMGEWQAFGEILAKKSKFIVGQKSMLCERVSADEAVLEERILKIGNEWECQKPTSGNVSPLKALELLESFSKSVSSVFAEYEILMKARRALDMERGSADQISPIIAEIGDLTEVWQALSGVWDRLENLKSVPWVSEESLGLRSKLDEVSFDLKRMPNRLRQYAAFQAVQEKVEHYTQAHAKCLCLKSESLRERHWNRILATVEMQVNFKSLRVGDVWENSLFQSKEKAIEELISLAEGEMGIENYLIQVESIWEVYKLEFINFQNKCRLVRGWDDLFNICKDHLSALSAMKSSVHFKVFKDRALNLESTLNRLFSLLDVWVKVQKQWVYLQGVFTGNLEIKQILPLEFSRFSAIDTEFMNTLRKVYKAPLVIDTLAIPSIQQTMQRLCELLTGIQKSLGEYLERERSNFARFYFLSDEDLLEILGNARDFSRAVPHLRKMFPAIFSLQFSIAGDSVLGFVSKEKEVVLFQEPIPLTQGVRVYQWLEAIEIESKRTLAYLLGESLAFKKGSFLFQTEAPSLDSFSKWISNFPAQILILSLQVMWTKVVEECLSSSPLVLFDLPRLVDLLSNLIKMLAVAVVHCGDSISRKKHESLLNELIHQRDITTLLSRGGISSASDFLWLSQMRFYHQASSGDVTVKIANSSFPYGFEYLGLQDRLVQTPLTDRCYLTLTQALSNGFGGSPFGPAGTGKTETVKALASQLGRQCLVFCCDESFDFQSVGRIFLGLSKVGAWGCFDEFNRLEESILSAVSQQVQSIQYGLKSKSEIELVGKSVTVNANTGIFITMNPGYAGRSELPDNLTSLFRAVAMTKPDRLLIAQVMLFSQGFRCGDQLAKKVVPFFEVCQEQLSFQQHYDFGLRALKSVLVAAGRLQRRFLLDHNNSDLTLDENVLLLKSIRETVFPKLVMDDVVIANSILTDIFGPSGAEQAEVKIKTLIEHVQDVCQLYNFLPDVSWLEKVIQIYTIQDIHHGIMIVGPSATGKTSAWKTLFKAVDRLDGTTGICHIIEPKAVAKESLYGHLDSTTREWTDGIFTRILRDILEDSHGLGDRRHWIVFDGDVDPEWIENLNSVLDDNKTLTLPNGERLPLPHNVRLLFEVESLEQATPATVSRCGMVWFPEGLVTNSMISYKNLSLLQKIPVDEIPGSVFSLSETITFSQLQQTQTLLADALEKFLAADGLVELSLRKALVYQHIMSFSNVQALENFFALARSSMRKILDYNSSHPDFPLETEHSLSFFTKSVLVAIGWSFGGDLFHADREVFGRFVFSTAVSLHMRIFASPKIESVFDADPDLSSNGEWNLWQSSVPTFHLESQSLSRHDLIIPTTDTLMHENILYAWLSEHRSLILCGPPGSGKTMTLLSSLRKLPDCDVVPLNFSSETEHDLIIKTLEVYCRYEKTCIGEILKPKLDGRWLVLFCDEINLPKPDQYGTQRIISLLRQLVEQGGFWRKDGVWVTTERIQVIGACNPPTDPGRVVLSNRFLRHCSVVFVDYPGQDSLLTIYTTLSRAALQCHPGLRGHAELLAQALVRFYIEAKACFTTESQSHYVYSPRELTRWIKGIYEIISKSEFVSLSDLVRIWAHEGLRLFRDRLVENSERLQLDSILHETAKLCFTSLDHDQCLAEPILFSNFLSRTYESVGREELYEFVQEKLQKFYEEELDKPLVLFDMALDHILRIDRVFRQPQGHMLLIGISGSGKSTLTRFVAWMSGISVFQPSMHAKYSISDFEDDLKTVLKRSGYKGEKICFILDEANILDSSFLERMNTLLANSEIPGLFTGDEYSSLMTACKEASLREGLSLDNHDDIYDWFTKQVAKNLHIVFTMNPPSPGDTGKLSNRTTSSPALFNRCVLNWMGDWDHDAFFHVGKEFTFAIDLDQQSFIPPIHFQPHCTLIRSPYSLRDTAMDLLIFVHASVQQLALKSDGVLDLKIHITPRQFLDFVNSFSRIYLEKRNELEERQRHLLVGLDRLNETLEKVEELQNMLGKKKIALEDKTFQANEKLQNMIKDQQTAESKRAVSLTMQKSLEEKNAQIAQRKDIVQSELAQAEPAVVEAQESVSSIKKQHLTELRSMGNPPSAVKMTMESVCILLGHKVDSWKSVQTILRRDDFISSIVNYDTSSLTFAIRKEITENYLSDQNYSFENANRASKACGPLLSWVSAQVTYANILEKVEPLRAELIQLEESAEVTKLEAKTVDELVVKLEQSINVYKDEYAVLISDVQALKREMDVVKERVERSVKVLENLDSERTRWSVASESFGSQMSSLVGDTLLCAAYFSYCGAFDQENRSALLKKWKKRLQESGIKYQGTLSIPEYLSMEETRRSWATHSLPSDNLCIENAVMLESCDRYPLIIDPSGQALQFLKSYYKQRSIVITSFRDPSFLKTLESAIRFGNVILIQDCEAFDCIINPLLQKEIRKSGGRSLVRLGNKDVDFSPNFKLFLMSKNSSQKFSPDISSRVSFVNFTITHASLQRQCLDRFLRSERPDVEIKRKDLLQMQGEFQYKLHRLEKLLLQALNESSGNILDDEKVLSSLESLKQEASEITQKVSETDNILAEVEAVTAVFEPLAEKAASIFFVIQRLSSIRTFYSFSLDYYFEVFGKVLKKSRPSVGQTDYLEALETSMFCHQFQSISCSLFHQDILLFGLLLAQIRLEGEVDEVSIPNCWTLFPEQSEVFESTSKRIASLSVLFGDRVAKRLNHLVSIAATPFTRLADGIEKNAQSWKLVVDTAQPESLCHSLLQQIDSSVSPIVVFAILFAFRPERFTDACLHYLRNVFGSEFVSHIGKGSDDLLEIPGGESWKPYFLLSEKGQDIGHRVEAAAKLSSNTLFSVAMGSAENIQQVDTALVQACRSGSWLLVKNAHLALSWLAELDKKVAGLASSKFISNGRFRLFITCEVQDNLPANMIRSSKLLVFEAVSSVKQGLRQSFSSVPKSLQENSKPLEKIRLFFMLSWLHAIIIERSKYIPVGWSKHYDFGHSDFELGVSVVDSWLQHVSGGRSNISPDKIPWDALQTLLARNVYGGKVDNISDQRVLDTLINQHFCADMFNSDFTLVRSKYSPSGAITAPSATKYHQYCEWIESLPEEESPGWLGLGTKADELLKENQATTILKSLKSTFKPLVQVDFQKGGIMPGFDGKLESWLSLIPEVNGDEWTSNGPSSIDAFLRREIMHAQKTLKLIKSDLQDLQAVVKGTSIITNDQRDYLFCLGTLMKTPVNWIDEKSKILMNHQLPSFDIYLLSLIKSFRQLSHYISSFSSVSRYVVDLTCIRDPEAFLIATRQMSASHLNVSLEQLELECKLVGKQVGSSKTSTLPIFEVTGLVLCGAKWIPEKQRLELQESVASSALAPVSIRWVDPATRSEVLSKMAKTAVQLPVYINASRNHVLMQLSISEGNLHACSEQDLVVRSVCVTL